MVCLLMVLVGCEQSAVEEARNIQVVEIDGCEYIACRTYMNRMVFTHKGNCKNSIHIYKEVGK